MNNASIGFYGKVVQSPEYRDAKLRTVIEMLPDLLGPGAVPFDLRFSDPGGVQYETAQLVLVSNNRYQLDPLGVQGTRGAMDGRTLSVVVVPDGPPLRRVREWTTFRFEIDSGDTIDVGLDGEALRLEPPLLFESLPAALRIRTPAGRRHPAPPPLRRMPSSLRYQAPSHQVRKDSLVDLVVLSDVDGRRTFPSEARSREQKGRTFNSGSGRLNGSPDSIGRFPARTPSD